MITERDFSFTQNKEILTFYFRGQLIGTEYTYSRVVNLVANTFIRDFVEGHGSYHTQRKIREIEENKIFPSIYNDVDSYVKDWPNAERFKHWLTSVTYPVTIFQSTGDYCMLPGGYHWVYIAKLQSGKYSVNVHDADDGACCKIVDTQLDGERAITQILNKVPIDMFKIVQYLGFTWD